MPVEHVTNTIKVHRAMQNLTQAELAARAGVARRSVNVVETGKMIPSIRLALQIARALNVQVDALFSLETQGS